MFYKINALKNLAILTEKHLCWRFFLINFIKKRLQHRCFPANVAKCLRSAFYTLRSHSLYFSEFLYDDRILLILQVENWYFSYFLCHSFVFLHNSSVRIGSPLLFRIYLVFMIKFLLSETWQWNGGSFAMLNDSLKFRNNSRNMWIWVFWILRYHFSLEAFLQGMAKNNPTEKTNRSKIYKATLKHVPVWKLTEEKI